MQLLKEVDQTFEIPADSHAFGTAEQFITYQPQPADPNAPLMKIITLYQHLLRFHMNDSQPDALVDADLNRLLFVNAYGSGKMKSQRFIQRLSELADRYRHIPPASLACYYWARELLDQERYSEFHQVASRGVEMHPESTGARLCRQLINQLHSKELDLACEYAVSPARGAVQIMYKNVDTVYLRIVKGDWARVLGEQWASPAVHFIKKKEQRRILELPAVAEWSVSLESVQDYKQHIRKIDLPPLEPGFYRIIVSGKKDFSLSGNAIRIGSFWMTGIYMVLQQLGDKLTGRILDAESGSPLPQAEITFYQQDPEGYYRSLTTEYTDDHGIFQRHNLSDTTALVVHTKFGADELLYPDSLYKSDPYRAETQFEKAFIFTDRTAYHPNEALHFKVLAVRCDPDRGSYRCLNGHELEIVLSDRFNQRIESVIINTNAFGTVSGKFTIPPEMESGHMSIQCANIEGSTPIQVLHGTQPEFKVDLALPEQVIRLNDEVRLSGSVMECNGAPLEHAAVSFRVIRRTLYPQEGTSRTTSLEELAVGTVHSDTHGNFSFTFRALPDRRAKPEDAPTFSYCVNMEVTDERGRIRRISKRFEIGYETMLLHVSFPSWLPANEDIEVTIEATDYAGTPLNVSGRLAIYTLQTPDQPERQPLFESPADTNNDGADGTRWPDWELAETVQDLVFDTANGPDEIRFSLQPGAYKAVATARGRFGNEIREELPMMIIDPESRQFPIPLASAFISKSLTCNVGGKFEALWGTGYTGSQAYFEIEHRGRIILQRWTDPSCSQEHFIWPVKQAYQGGFEVHLTHIAGNRAYYFTRHVDVPVIDKQLKLSSPTFSPKLSPGADVTCTIKVEDGDSNKPRAELIAALFDSSSDLNKSHDWPDLSGLFRPHQSSLYYQFGNRAVQGISVVDNWNPPVRLILRTYRSLSNKMLEEFSLNIPFSYDARNAMKKKLLESLDKESLAETAYENLLPLLASSARSNAGTHDENTDIQSQTTITGKKRYNDTVFFLPHLETDNGLVTFTFTMPERNSKFKLIGFAHTKNLMSGQCTYSLATQGVSPED